MTVNTVNIVSGPYLGNGTSDTFSYTFRIDLNTQLEVWERSVAGVWTLLTLTTDYTVAGVGNDAGGTITLVAGNLASGKKLYIRSNYQATQLTDFESQGAFFPDIHEAAMDKMTFLIQQLQDQADRSFRLSPFFDIDGTLEIDSEAADRAEAYLQFDASGNLTLVNQIDPTTISFPVQTNKEDKFLQTDGSILSWADSIPMYDTVAAMKAASPEIGSWVGTKGYYTIGDSGHALYRVAASAAVDGYGDHTLANGNIALLQVDSVIPLEHFGVGSDGADYSNEMLAAVAWASSRNGAFFTKRVSGVVGLTQSIIVEEGNIRFRFPGGSKFRDGGIGDDPFITFTWLGGGTAAVWEFRTPNSGVGEAKRSNMELSNCEINCNSIAERSLIVTSVYGSTFENLYSYGAITEHYRITTYTSTGAAEAMDTQMNRFIGLRWRSLDGATLQAARGLVLTSHNPLGPSTANVSLNEFRDIDGQMYGGAGGGVGIAIEDADNCHFYNTRVIRASGTTSFGVLIVGNTYTDGITFEGFSCAGANGVVIQGTVSGYAQNPQRIIFLWPDTGNGTIVPLVNSGVNYSWLSDDGYFQNYSAFKLVVSDQTATAKSERANIGASSLLVHNGSNNHIRIKSGSAEWGLNIDGATGDLRMNRLSGSGAVNVGNGASVKINSKLVSEGVADSGGAGYRVLRVPN